MAGLLTSVNQADFVPEIWANEAFSRLREELVIVQHVTKDSDINADFADIGKVLNIPILGDFTATAKTETGDIVLQDPSSSKVYVTLDKHYHVAFSASSFLRAVQCADIEEVAQMSGIGVLAEKVESSIFELYASATYSEGTAGVDIDESLVLAVKQRMNMNRCPRNGRFLALSPKDETAMLKIDRFTSAEKIGQAGKIAEGAMGKCQGFDCFGSNLIPTTGAAPVSTHNLAWTKGGIILASRKLPEIKGAKSSTYMQDPNSGLIFRITLGYNASKNEDQIVIDALWGTAILRQEMVVRVLT